MGHKHMPGCDHEMCAKCCTQRISCPCGDAEDEAIVPFGFELTNQNDLWLEFESEPLEHDAGFKFTVCGLCGNNGRINIPVIKAPMGREVRGAQGYCICPNGRAMKPQG